MFANFIEDFHEWLDIYHFTPTTLEKSTGVWPIRLGANIAKKNYHIGPRVSPYYYILCVIDGKGTFHQGGKTFTLQKNDIFALFPQVTHEYYTEPEFPLSKMFVAFDGRSSLALLEKIGITPEQPHLSNRVSDKTLDVFHQLYTSQHSDLSRLSYLYLLFESLSVHEDNRLLEMNHSQQSWLLRGKEYMEMHYADHITIEGVAKYVGVERTYFSKMFHKLYGISPIGYLQKLRMEEAKLLLLQTNYKLIEIANSVGFIDLPTFSKAFKKTYGTSPSLYKRQHV